MLRDRLVCGVNHAGIQRKLLAQADLTYETAYTLALSVEASDRDTKTLEKQQHADQPPTLPVTDAVHFTSAKPKPTSRSPSSASIHCFRCGGPHLATTCKYTDITCNFCKRKGHLEKVCMRNYARQHPRGTRNRRGRTTWPGSPRRRGTSTSHQSSKPYIVDIFVNDKPVKMELDTGASVSVLNEATYRDILQSSPPLQPASGQLQTYTGDCIKVLGVLDIKVRYGESELLLSAHIVNGGGPNLMGRDWISKFEVKLCDLKVIQAQPLQTITQMFSLTHRAVPRLER